MPENQTTTPAPDSIATTSTDDVFEALAGDVPDLKIVAASSPGHQGEYDINGKLLREWPVGGAGQPLVTQGPNDQVSSAAPELEKAPEPEADAKEGAAPEGAAADGAEGAAGPIPAGGEKTDAGIGSPAAATAPADGGTPPVEEKPADVGAAREAALKATAEPVQHPSQPPKEEDAPVIDWSDEPNWEDGEKYPTEKDALEARRKYIADKSAQHAEAIAEHRQKAAQANAQAAAQENAARAMQARQIEYLRQTQKALDMDDAAFQSRGQDYAMIRHPQPSSVNTPNPVGQLLYQARDQYLIQRASMGLPVNDHESVAEILTEQWRDLDFAKAVAGVAPDTPIGGLVVAAVAQLPAPVRMLRHLVSNDGQEQVKEITELYGDGRDMNGHTYRAAAQQVANRIARIDAGLKDAPAPKAAKAEAAPAPAEKPAAATSPGPGRFTANVPAAPRSGAAPAHTSSGGGAEPEPFSQAWIDAEVKKATASHAVN